MYILDIYTNRFVLIQTVDKKYGLKEPSVKTLRTSGLAEFNSRFASLLKRASENIKYFIPPSGNQADLNPLLLRTHHTTTASNDKIFYEFT